ncbi:MAG: hypothetical protein ACRC11_12495 [Xenococcaceae cyanobacterium]
MTDDNYDEKYTDPELRRQLKEKILESDRGGKPGQWSARKSQILVKEYEKQGGDYKKDEKDEAAKSLEQWSQEDWQTEEGDDRAREDNTTKRYLPKAVWDKLSKKEKKEAEHSKEKADKKGKQHVKWTPAIKKAMVEYENECNSKKSNLPQGVLRNRELESKHEPTKKDLYEQAKTLNIQGRSKMSVGELKKAIDSFQK